LCAWQSAPHRTCSCFFDYRGKGVKGELYVNEKGSLKEISEITGVTVRMIMGTLRKKSIPLRMGEEVFDTGMERARRVFWF